MFSALPFCDLLAQGQLVIAHCVISFMCVVTKKGFHWDDPCYHSSNWLVVSIDPNIKNHHSFCGFLSSVYCILVTYGLHWKNKRTTTHIPPCSHSGMSEWYKSHRSWSWSSFLFGFWFLVGFVNSCSSGVPEENRSHRPCLSTCLLDTVTR